MRFISEVDALKREIEQAKFQVTLHEICGFGLEDRDVHAAEQLTGEAERRLTGMEVYIACLEERHQTLILMAIAGYGSGEVIIDEHLIN